MIAAALRRLAGRAGGVLGYAALDLALGVLNGGRRARAVPASVARDVQPLVPDLDLARVRLVECANLAPLRWARCEPLAIALGYTVYFRDRLDPGSRNGQLLIAHELFHVEQLRRLGNRRLRFAACYGEGYVVSGLRYDAHPMENEARDFERVVAAHLAAGDPAHSA